MINLKRLLIYFFLTLGIFSLFAEAPELKNVMPNSWQKIERVMGEDEQRVIAENDSNIREIIGMIKSWYDIGVDIVSADNLYIKAYRQQIGVDIFYRFFVTDREADTYDELGRQHIQIVVWEKGENHITLGAGIYPYLIVTQYGTKLSHTSIDIIESGGTAKAILISQVKKLQGGELTRDGRSRNGEPDGEVDCYYYTLNDYERNVEFNIYNEGSLLPKNIPYISIEGSPCLVDINSPLRYGLQSAFDGNPATSYVENTEDDLMWIEIPYKGSFEQIAIINGYAQNKNLYDRNNRVRTIGIESLDWNDEHSYLIYKMKQEIPLLDNYLSYQFANVDSLRKITVLSKYNGSSYNDTCIAELNLFTEDNNWLFGDIENEQ